MESLGQCYLNGYGTDVNPKIAAQWFEKAANLGNPNSQISIGLLYKEGNGVNKNYGVARQWFKKAADKNDVKGLFHLGMSYMIDEFGNIDDPEQGLVWIRKAAALNYPIALYILGLAYRDGLGMDQDLYKAKDFLRKASSLGYEPARKVLEELL